MRHQKNWTRFLILLAAVVVIVSSQAAVTLAQDETPTEAGKVQSLQRPKGNNTSDETKANPAEAKQEKKVEEKESEGKSKDSEGWRPLLPEEGLEGWEVTDFGIPGKVERDGKQLILQMGDPLNGITSKKKDFPTDNFEIYLEANRLEGSDFLVGLTFPVADEFCSLIAGGWGGGLVGLSSVDDYDASENATTTYYEFENEKWYRFRLRVDPEYIRAWIDDKEFFRQEREGHEFSTRIEVYASQPLGLCAFMSKVAVRDFKWRPIGEAAKAEQTKKSSSESGAGSPVKPID